MAEIDWTGFSADVRQALDGLSIHAAVAKWPGTNAALWSRAKRGRQPLSAENYLQLCRLLSLDPWARWSAIPKPKRLRRRKARTLADIVRNQQIQPVTVSVSRGTGGAP